MKTPKKPELSLAEKRAEVEARKQERERAKITVCEECAVEFKRRRPWQKYCGGKCRWAAWDREHPRMKKIS